jgi:hypothetical protein
MAHDDTTSLWWIHTSLPFTHTSHFTSLHTPGPVQAHLARSYMPACSLKTRALAGGQRVVLFPFLSFPFWQGDPKGARLETIVWAGAAVRWGVWMLMPWFCIRRAAQDRRASDAGSISLKGNADAAVIPWSVCDLAAGLELRVIFDWVCEGT